MNILKKIRILLACLTLFSVKIKAQDVSINIINQPATLTQGSALGRVMVDICNNDGGSRNAAVGKLRPLISFPSSLVGNTVVPITFVGWTVLANDGQSIRLENTVAIAPGECSHIVLGYTGVNIGGPLTVTGTMGFNGPQTVGNLTGNDNSTTSITIAAGGTDSDGDGDPDVSDPAANDPCSWGVGQVIANTTLVWRNADCDGDGVTNYAEATGLDGNPATIADNTDPKSACSLNITQVTLMATSSGDCDGDGVTNKDEINGLDRNPLTTADNTNPLDLCSYNAVDQVIANTSQTWRTSDCDKDGNTNFTDPNPNSPTANNDVLTTSFGSTGSVNVLLNDDFLPNITLSIARSGGTAQGTVTFSPTTGFMTYSPLTSEQGSTVSVNYQVCNTAVSPSVCANAVVNITVTGSSPRLSITKAVSSGLYSLFDNFTYTLTVNNTGSVPTSGMIIIKDTLQMGLALVSATVNTGWGCSASGQLVTCTRTNSIPAGGSSSVTITVAALQAGTFYNKAGVYGGGDPVAINGITAAQSNVTTTFVAQFSVRVTLKVFLKGAYNPTDGLMLDNLRSQGLIPLVQPYGKGAYADIPHIGPDEITTSDVLAVTGNNAIVDWVSVELRDKNNPTSILASRSGLIQRDGDIVDVDGVSCLRLMNISNNSYYIAIRHRNHLAVMSALSYPLSDACFNLIDFTSPSVSIYTKPNTDPEFSAYPMMDVGGIRALWGGNASPDRFVIYQGPNNDRTFVGSVILTDPNNTESLNNYMVNGYLRADLNLDGNTILQGPNNDINLLFNEIFTHPENAEKLNNFIIFQQLP